MNLLAKGGYAFCSEHAGKQVTICISQQTDNPKLANEIFDSFKWTEMSQGRTSSGLRLQGETLWVHIFYEEGNLLLATGGPTRIGRVGALPQLYVKSPSPLSLTASRFIVSITLSDGRVIERKTGTVDMQTQLKICRLRR